MRRLGAALAAVVLLAALASSFISLVRWADELDGYARARAYATPSAVAPLDRCQYAWQKECLP